ncbi:MAG: UvrD-helicase domain-containing protein [Planctomycetes bacterium]|nr:UvrD-helicase domain-containing protein [Planctomycetota bacterium]
MSVDDSWTLPADDLTPEQRAAVEHFEGPLLVLAGPGSGKTRVITRRIARLIERGVRSSEILAITFTNKAAREMGERVQALLPGSRIWVSTFHRFCARLLRERGSAVGLRPNFSIFDTSDQHQVIKQVLHDLNLDATHFPPGKLGQRISHAKNELLTAPQYIARHGEGIGTHLEAVVARVYPAYQQRLLEANAVDFDDLLMHVALLLAENDDLRSELDQRYRFILVDEYQDTNRAQYQIVAALSQLEPNLCATGDPDQSIYGWRGARIENILRFEQDFPNVALIRLEANFRSTPEILQTAENLIAHNVYRKAKRLRTSKPSGESVELRQYGDGQDEATGITNEIRALVESGERQWKDFAIFYRVNSLSRSLETALARQKIPFQVAGSVAFFERMEVKDLLGYLRLIENPLDRVAFLRIVNTPTRGIGKSSLEKLVRWADSTGTSLLDAARHPGQVPDLPKKTATQLRAFASLIDELATPAMDDNPDPDPSASAVANASTDHGDAAVGPVEGLLRAVMLRTGYARQFDDPHDEQDMQRRSNIDELVSAARLFDVQESEPGPTLAGFLETASLAQDLDSLDEASGAVTLMTLHAAKGLEFPIVYIIAVEQNLIPHERSLRENDLRQLEEERRLLFVGITRAEEKLVLSHTQRRDMHGRSLSTIPSDFLGELNLISRDFTGMNDFQFGDDSSSEVFSDHAGADACTNESDSLEWTARDALRSRSTYDAPPPSKAKRTSAMKGLGLTTAAALQAGTNEPVELRRGFSVGMQVRHPRYGLGTVVDVGGMSRRRTVTVEFNADNRRECFVEEKCPLQPVGFRY